MNTNDFKSYSGKPNLRARQIRSLLARLALNPNATRVTLPKLQFQIRNCLDTDEYHIRCQKDNQEKYDQKMRKK